MYDELVKALRDMSQMGMKYGMSVVKMREAADAIEELSRDLDSMNEANIALYGALPKWIPVTERLPEDMTRVIVFCEDGVSYGLCEHLIADDTEVVEWHDFLHYPITPTHWMPLPQPPKEET